MKERKICRMNRDILPESKERVARLLRRTRKSKKLTLERAAEAAGISKSYLASIEKNEKKASLKFIQNLDSFYELNGLLLFLTIFEYNKDKGIKPKNNELMEKLELILQRELDPKINTNQ